MLDAVIDLSHHNAAVDFSALAAGGVVGVLLKATEGIGCPDPTFDVRVKAARAAGLLVGAYHFGTGAHGGYAQAHEFLAAIEPHGIALTALDCESSGSPITGAIVLDLLDGVREATGRWPMVYGSGDFLRQMTTRYPSPWWIQCPLWLAAYRDTLPAPPPPWTVVTLWQWTQNGSVAGVTGPVDRDRFNGDADGLRRLFGEEIA